MAVNKERVRAWVEALESGRYSQAQDTLAKYNPDTHHYSYCCLGVACQVAVKGGLEGVRRTRSDTGRSVFYLMGDGVTEDNALPPEVAEWFGFESDPNLPEVNGNSDDPTNPNLCEPPAVPGDLDVCYAASHWNDDVNDHRTFKQIAAMVRRRWLDD